MHHSPHKEPQRPLEGRVALVTGATDGLGREVAIRLGAGGARVLVHGRDGERGRAVVETIQDRGGEARFHRADLASVEAARRLAEAVQEEVDRLDVLVNNAGLGPGERERRVTEDGHERVFAVNYLAGFLLTRLLLPFLKESAPSRIVNVASGAQTALDFDDLMLERDYDGGRAYAQSKLAQVLFTFDLARELEGTGVTANALHPATLMDTTLVRRAGDRPRASVSEGADAVMHLITAPDAGTGRFFDGTRPVRAHRQAYDEGARRRLRELSEQLTGVNGTA